MELHFHPIILPAALAAFCSAGLVVILWRRRIHYLGRALLATFGGLFIWSFGEALELSSATLEAKLFWARIRYIGIVTMPVAFVLFAIGFHWEAYRPRKRHIVLLCVIPVITLVLVWTNSRHGLIWAETWLDHSAPVPLVATEQGAWYYVHLAYCYALLFTSFLLLVRAFVTSSVLYRYQISALVVMVMTPFIANVLFNLSLVTNLQIRPYRYYDLTPPAMLISSLACAWAMIRTRFMDVMPVARDRVFAGMQDAVLVVDARGRIVDTNPAARNICDRSPTGQNVAALEDFEPALDPGLLEATLQNSLQVRFKPTGNVYSIRSSVLKMGKESGKLVLLRDITAEAEAEAEREAAVAQLSESEERFRQLAAASPVCFWIAEANPYRFLYLSPAFEDIWGREPAEIETGSSDILDTIHPDDREQVDQALERLCIRPAQTQTIEYRIVRPDGSVRWIRDSITGVAGIDGRLFRLTGLAQDITEAHYEAERRHMLELRIQQTQKLESLGLLAGGVAHDFNNLILGIMGNLELSSIEDELPNKVKEYLGDAIGLAQHAADLCGQLLAYSGKGAFMLKPVDLSREVEAMEGLLAAVVPKKIRVQYDLAANLPAIRADSIQLRQIAMNLVTNAAEAIGDLHGVISIQTGLVETDLNDTVIPGPGESRRRGEYVKLRISDTGAGIELENLDRIFDPFFTTKFSGRGLGLAAVSGMVRAHRGAIQVDSGPDEGVTFTVLFHATKGTVADATEPGQLISAGVVSGTVLVVDDEPGVRRVCEAMLRGAGLGVLAAENGAAALEMARNRPADVDLLLLDITMPDVSGVELHERLAHVLPNVPVIFMTGYNEYADPRGGERGPILKKPFRRESLLVAVQLALKGAATPPGEDGGL